MPHQSTTLSYITVALLYKSMSSLVHFNRLAITILRLAMPYSVALTGLLLKSSVCAAGSVGSFIKPPVSGLNFSFGLLVCALAIQPRTSAFSFSKSLLPVYVYPYLIAHL